MKQKFLSTLLSALLLLSMCLSFVGCGECEVHTFGVWTTSVQATCNAPGQQKRTCSACGAEETQAIPQLSHSFGAWTTSVQATCQSTGTDMRTCSLCGTIETTTTPIGSHSEVKGKCQYCNAVMNAYDVLLYAVKDNGSYKNGSYTLILGNTKLNDGSSYTRAVMYDSEDNELQIAMLYEDYLFTITLSKYSTIYDYTLYGDTYDYIMIGSFYPSSFSQSTSYLYYTDTNISYSSLITSFRELGASMARLLLTHLTTDLSVIGVTAYDLGFLNY